MKMFLVREFMSQPAITIHSQAKVTEAHDLMKDKHIRRLPVVDDAKLVGIITLLDASDVQPNNGTLMRPTAHHVAMTLLKVEDAMTHHPITISPEATILDAARLMARHAISGLPVVDQGRVVGMLTESDAFRAIVRAADEEARVVEGAATGISAGRTRLE